MKIFLIRTISSKSIFCVTPVKSVFYISITTRGSMNSQQSLHTFHVPVMGIGFTIDTPIKVAHYGISSVMSLVDDILVEKMREFYSQKLNLPYAPITEKNSSDHRAERITAYLNMVDKIVHDKFAE